MGPKRILCLLFLLLSLMTESLQAQEQEQEVVIKLKDGNSLKGRLLQFKQQGYQLQLAGNTVVYIPLNDIEEIKAVNTYQKRFYATAQLGLFFGLRPQQEYQSLLVAPSLQLSGGYKWKHWLQPGLGTGLEQYGKIKVIPVYAEVQGSIWSEGLTPYYVLKVGKGFAEVKDDYRYQDARGGLMAEAQAGINFRFRHFNWLIGTGYRLQKVRLEGVSPGWGGENKRVQYRDLRRLISTTSVRFSF